MSLVGNVCIILAVFIQFVHLVIDRKKSRIGEQGKKRANLQVVMMLFSGILFLCGVLIDFIFYRVLKIKMMDKSFDYLLIFCAVIGVASLLIGCFVWVRSCAEDTSQLLTSNLVDCRITHETYRSNYYMVKGTSLENNKNIFNFYGKDRAIIEQALKEGKNQFTIRYYKSSGRIYEIS